MKTLIFVVLFLLALSFIYQLFNNFPINNYAKQVHTTKQKEEKISAAKKMLAAAKFLGLMRQNTAQWFHGGIDTKAIESLIAKRKQAKAAKDWALADKIRQDLQHKGIIIEDKPGGITNWKVIK